MPYNNTINYRYICNYTYNYNYSYCVTYRVHSCISFGTWSCLLRVFNNLIGAPASFAGMCKFKDFLQLCECIMPLEITVLLLFLLRFVVVVCCLRQTWFHSKCCGWPSSWESQWIIRSILFWYLLGFCSVYQSLLVITRQAYDCHLLFFLPVELDLLQCKVASVRETCPCSSKYDFTRLSQPGRDDVGPWQGLQAFGIGSNQLRLARGCRLSLSWKLVQTKALFLACNEMLGFQDHAGKPRLHKASSFVCTAAQPRQWLRGTSSTTLRCSLSA